MFEEDHGIWDATAYLNPGTSASVYRTLPGIRKIHHASTKTAPINALHPAMSSAVTTSIDPAPHLEICVLEPIEHLRVSIPNPPNQFLFRFVS